MAKKAAKKAKYMGREASGKGKESKVKKLLKLFSKKKKKK